MTALQLQRIRAKLGLTQAEAAAKIGVHGRTWRKWELGERPIPDPVEHLVRMILMLKEKEAANAVPSTNSAC